MANTQHSDETNIFIGGQLAAKHSRLTSWEISQYLIELGRPATAKEVAQGLRERYPQYNSTVSEIYLRMSSIAKSHNSDCRVDDSVRPRTFHLTRLDDEFFKRCRNPERIDPERRKVMLMTEEEKERAESRIPRLALKIMAESARRRLASG
ncbi:Late promoter-activating protein [Chimaeribacter californicus]|uniref:Late promoter-activating protein n=1 Tax=Chimaeribacter californicus TaxID=2060067 RepID=A0A2N5DSR1_9GAMM|nr:Late promoter-activating protein [Chimaeribacter californicus]